MEFIIRLYETYIILYTFNSDKHHVPINQKRSSDLNLNFEVKFLNSWLVNLYSNLKIEFNAKQDFFLFTLIKKSIKQLLSLVRIQKISILLITSRLFQDHRASLQIPRGFLFLFQIQQRKPVAIYFESRFPWSLEKDLVITKNSMNRPKNPQ